MTRKEDKNTMELVFVCFVSFVVHLSYSFNSCHSRLSSASVAAAFFRVVRVFRGCLLAVFLAAFFLAGGVQLRICSSVSPSSWASDSSNVWNEVPAVSLYSGSISGCH